MKYQQMQDIFARIEGCWGFDTSYCDDNLGWELESTGYFQCATTTALLHDIYGGEVMMGEVNGRRHYWNRINGIEVDITRRQFSAGTIICGIKVVSPNVLVTDDWMMERYGNLKRRFYSI